MGFDVFDPLEDARKNRLRIHTFDGPSVEDMDLFKERIREQKKVEAKLFPIKRRRCDPDSAAAAGEGDDEGAGKAETKEEKDPMQKQRDELRALLFKRERLLLKLREFEEQDPKRWETLGEKDQA